MAAIKVFTDFRDVVTNFNGGGVGEIIIDLRVNAGGEDALAAAISGLFCKDTAFYEYWAQYDLVSDSVKIYPQMLPMYKPITLQKYFNPNYPWVICILNRRERFLKTGGCPRESPEYQFRRRHSAGPAEIAEFQDFSVSTAVTVRSE